MKNRWWVLAVSMMLPFLAACDSSKDDPQTVTLTAEDNGRTVTLAQGAMLEVILKGNPTAGFQWKTVAINPAVLRYQKTEYTPDSSEIGAGGTYVFTYLDIGLGTSPLQLDNSSTNGADVIQTFK